MNNFLDTLQGLSGLWETWAGVTLLAFLGAYSVYHRLSCPYISGKKVASLDEAQSAIAKPIFAGPRFLAVMVLGISMSITGLYMLYTATQPGAGFFMIIIGMVILQTEPIKLQIREAQHKVVASCAYDDEARLAATETLKDRADWLSAVYFVILACVVAGLLAF